MVFIETLQGLVRKGNTVVNAACFVAYSVSTYIGIPTP